MRTILCTPCLCCALWALAGMAAAQTQVPATAQKPEARGMRLVTPAGKALQDLTVLFGNPPTSEELAAAELALSNAIENLERAKRRVQAGMSPESEVRGAESEVAGKRAEYARLKTAYESRQRVQALNRLVDVQLQNAPIRQAAEAMSRASGLKITVDPDVPQDTRVSVDARHIPLASVLEAVANQTNLVIAPQDGGAILERWPALVVNGSGTRVPLRNPPWTDAWGLFAPTNPLMSSGVTMGGGGFSFGGSGGGGFAFGGGGTGGGGFTTTLPGGRMGSLSIAGRGGPASVSVTGVGSHIVIAEPGTNEEGEAGVWLTVYALNGGQLERVSSTFHRSPAGGTMKVEF